jgi:hypothetical protein
MLCAEARTGRHAEAFVEASKLLQSSLASKSDPALRDAKSFSVFSYLSAYVPWPARFSFP